MNANWNTGQQQTAVTGSVQPVVNVLPNTTETWAFASGTCGSETWAGITIAQEVTNVQEFINAGKKYIISTGGASGTFTCDAGGAAFVNFIKTYYSSNMVGVDFDIEGGQTQSEIDNLVTDVEYAQANGYGNLIYSFTVATEGGSGNPALGVLGVDVVNAIKSYGLGGNWTINLMTMDYGSTSASNCVVVSGSCEMGQSAVQAAIDLNQQFGIPYNHIEITPMIGGNDTSGETFTLSDVDTVSSFVKQNGLAGVHFWSLDRDVDCAPGPSSSTCNSYGQAGVLGFTNRFIADLGSGSGGSGSGGGTEAPYGGTPAAIAGTVMAENYDTGGQGVGYNVTSTNGTDNAYRSDGVDLEASSSPATGNDVGWSAAGQWFRYTVNVATSGTYTVTFLVADGSGAAVADAFHLSNAAGTNLTGAVAVPNTGGWQTWTTVTATVTLSAGVQTLTLNQDNGGWNLDSMAFALNSSGGGTEGPFGGTAAAIAGTVMAENYDTGGQGVGYNVTSTNGTDNAYRSDGVDLETASSPATGNDLGWTAAGQWFNYTVNVSTAGTYTVTFLVSDGSGAAVTDAFHLSDSSGADLTGSVAVPNTGGWQTWTTVTATVTLSAGVQILTLNQDAGGWNLDSMAFAFGSGPTVAIDSGGGAAGSYVADTDFSGGNTASTTATINTSNVSNPAPQAVYQTERWAPSTYTIPGFTAGSQHTVTLQFAEIYWTAAGQRQFNVIINGNQVLTNFDIFAAAGGENIAIAKTFTTTANSSGQIVIQFTNGAADNAKISGIEVQ